jgi:hypothetical protein
MKMGLGVMTMFVSIVFYFSLRRYITVTSKQHQLKNLNILIAASVANEFLCVFFPQVIKAVSALLRIPLWETLGTYVSVGSSISALVNALIYKLLIKDPGQRFATKQTPVQSLPQQNISSFQ